MNGNIEAASEDGQGLAAFDDAGLVERFGLPPVA